MIGWIVFVLIVVILGLLGITIVITMIGAALAAIVGIYQGFREAFGKKKPEPGKDLDEV